MRSILPAVILCSLAATPAAAATRNFGVSGFDRIRVDGPFQVSIATGVAPFAFARGPQAAIDAVIIQVEGRTMTIRANRSAWGGYPGAATGPVEIRVGTHELSSASLNGSGVVAIDRAKAQAFDLSVQGAGSASIGALTTDRLRITLFGPASARVGGSAAMLTAVVRGAGALDAAALKSKDATIGAEGSVTVSAEVAGTAKIQAQGSAVVTLTGRPACEVRASGSASVTGCR